MLSNQQKLAKKLRRVRIRCVLSQRKAAARAGVTQSYLAQVECGFRPISSACLGRLEVVYGVKFGKLWKGVGRRGRPAYAAPTREAMRRLGRAICEFVKVGEALIPPHPQPHQVRSMMDPLWPMALHLGREAREEVERLELLRAEDEMFWRNFNSLRFDSWSEKRLQVRLALLGGPLLGIRLARLGCKMQVIDGVTGQEAKLHRGYVIQGRDASLAWCPQVAVRTEHGYRCLDNLLVLSSGTRSVTLAVEVDGNSFHQDEAKERRRDAELGIPVLHISASQLGAPDLMRRILLWAHLQLEAA